MTTNNNTVVAIFKSHLEAETAIKDLVQSGIDVKKLSIVGGVAKMMNMRFTISGNA